MKYTIFLLIATFFLTSCTTENRTCLDTEKWLDFSVEQMDQALDLLDADEDQIPRNIPPGEKGWNTTGIHGWTSGFWPGLLWYAYESTEEEKWREHAHHWNMKLEPLRRWENINHDLGFMMYNSFGNGLRLTGNEDYHPILVDGAGLLMSLYNPTVGTILSWPFAIERYDGRHNTIVDNMINLEYLFWASSTTEDTSYREAAINHARHTAEHNIRSNSSTYHVALFNKETGDFEEAVTHQGAFDESMWARGQAWGIYGFTMTYRETGMDEFKDTARMLADKFIKELPDDLVPYWDFDAPNIPDEEKDASAAAIAASAMLELSELVTEPVDREFYREKAVNILNSLVNNYRSDGSNVAILWHSVGNRNRDEGGEVDQPIIYADYYFVEALLREEALQKKYPDFCS
ncbi:glycoside hydrolase family 88 protein [Natronogracilivirga saccharolytica]|uniref:Glycoside hydrolase family 88 protein n=1 Tax=Natronogracilivirga saccharolytica TaxID=2812953 RepID=A0A8J7RMU5_9BACT|nr:glycoside hydrolase family 88 protein [Natronogracilivirga saccharolytica]MBP3193875.1 glycoside hydrolase family 88 protein [Natronogracilivirga saccharolytica]